MGENLTLGVLAVLGAGWALWHLVDWLGMRAEGRGLETHRERLDRARARLRAGPPPPPLTRREMQQWVDEATARGVRYMQSYVAGETGQDEEDEK